jgi:hypothetical protein
MNSLILFFGIVHLQKQKIVQAKKTKIDIKERGTYCKGIPFVNVYVF